MSRTQTTTATRRAPRNSSSGGSEEDGVRRTTSAREAARIAAAGAMTPGRAAGLAAAELAGKGAASAAQGEAAEADRRSGSGCTAFTRIVKKTVSTVISLTCLGLIIYAIGAGHPALDGPWYVHFPLLVFAVALLGYLEGLQVAILNMEAVDSNRLRATPRAFATHKLAIKGNNVQRFLVGRQFWVIFVVFLSAQLTTYPTLELPIPRFLFIILIETGLPGALVVLALGQLMPQLISATHPVAMLNAPGAYYVVVFALTLEKIGVTDFAWVVTAICKFVLRLHKNNSVTARDLTQRDSGDEDEGLIDRSGFMMVHLEAETVPEVVDGDADILDAAASGLESVAVAATAGGGTVVTRKVEESIVQDFVGWGFTPRPDVYPRPAEIVRRLVAAGKAVPRFLLPPEDPRHIPPHIVAYSLLRKGTRAYQRVDLDDNYRVCGACGESSPHAVGSRHAAGVGGAEGESAPGGAAATAAADVSVRVEPEA